MNMDDPIALSLTRSWYLTNHCNQILSSLTTAQPHLTATPEEQPAAS